MARKVIIVGGGHNGLVAAGILQNAGMSCTVLEAKATVGGACRAQLFDGELVNWGANHLFMLSEDVLQRLKISPNDFDFKVAGQEAYFLNTADATKLLDPHDLEQFESDVEAGATILRKHLWRSEGSLEDLFRDFEGLELRSGLRFLEGSILDVMKFYFNTCEEDFGPLISGRVLSKYGIEEGGAAISFLYLAMSNDAFGCWSSPRKGMQAITDTLASRFLESGGELFLSTQVVRAKWCGDIVESIETSQGEIIEGDYFLFSGSPVQFEKIFSKHNRLNALASKGAGWGTSAQDGGCSKVMISSAVPLMFKGAPSWALEKTMLVNNLSVSEWRQALDEAEALGHSSNPYFEVFGSSEFHGKDSGNFVYSIFVMYSSFEYLSRLSLSRRDRCKQKLLSSLLRHVQNPEAIRQTQVMDPVDLQEDFGLAQGNVDHGRFAIDNILENRRFDLKLLGTSNVIGSGSGFFAGGLVTGVPGMLAAENVLKKEDDKYEH